MSESREFIFVEAGEKLEIYSRSFSSVPLIVEFGALSQDNEKLKGRIEVQSRNMWLAQPARAAELKNFNQVHVTMWNTFIKIYVKPECDIEISLPKIHLKSKYLIIVLIGLVILASSAILFSL